jgi:hypothetical protein
MNTKQQEQADAIAKLRELLPPGSTVYTILRHVSRSGMSRSISAVVVEDGEPVVIDYLVRHALGLTFDRTNGGLKVQGGGMDMGFHVVYSLSYALYPNGAPCIGEKCWSNDHINGDRDYTPHGCFDENGQPEDREPGPGEQADGCRRHWHRDGGYALRHRWL